MNGLGAAGLSFPTWAGSVPLWALLAAVLVALIKVWPRIKEIDANSEAGIRKEMHSRITELKIECAECQAAVRQLRGEYEEEIRKLREEYEAKIIGLQRQHAQEQISLINTIIESVPAPELKTLLKGLESVQAALRRAHPAGNPS